jgi:hypothetical protein
MVEYLAGNRIRGTSAERTTTGQTTTWQNVSFDSSTEVNGITSSGNKAIGTNVTGSSWTSYMRSNEFIDTATGGGEFYMTNVPQYGVGNFVGGFEKSPHNENPSAVYTNSNYGFHTTWANNNMYEKSTSYNGTDVNNTSTQEWKIEITSGGNVTYSYRANSSSSWSTERTTTGASGKFYINASFAGSSSVEPEFYIKGNVSTSNLIGDNLVDGSIFYETDTNKEYVLYNNTWTEV